MGCCGDYDPTVGWMFGDSSEVLKIFSGKGGMINHKNMTIICDHKNMTLKYMVIIAILSYYNL